MRFEIETAERLETVDVTEAVADAVTDDCERGLCTAFVEHTTAALVVQENESRLRDDLERFLGDVVPDEGHDHDALDGNADSHLRATLLGPSVTVPVEDGDLATGSWQSIVLVECDGPRQRAVSVTVVSE